VIARTAGERSTSANRAACASVEWSAVRIGPVIGHVSYEVQTDSQRLTMRRDRVREEGEQDGRDGRDVKDDGISAVDRTTAEISKIDQLAR